MHDRDGNEVICPNVGGVYFSICPACANKVAIHCDACSIQITGCSCTVRRKIQQETN